MIAASIAHFCCTFVIFDLPVYWQLLVAYFLVVFAVTMHTRIRHMIRSACSTISRPPANLVLCSLFRNCCL